MIQFIQSQASPPPCILVSEHERLAVTLPRCKELVIGATTDYEQDCIALAAQLGVGASDAAAAPVNGAVGAKPSVVRSKRDDFALIEIEVPDNTRFATVKYEIYVDDRISNNTAKNLGLSQKRWTAVDASRKLSDQFTKAFKNAKAYKQWQEHYRELGQGFYKLLDKNVFSEQFNKVKGAVEVYRNLNFRVRFSLGRSVFDGLWEFDMPPTGDHLMLEATITRRGMDTVSGYPDSPSGPVGTLNILVIGATLDDNSRPQGPPDLMWQKLWGKSVLHSLPHIEKEVAAIKALEQLPYNVKVDVLSGESRHQAEQPWSLAREVEKCLKRNGKRYDVIILPATRCLQRRKRKLRTKARERQRRMSTRTIADT